MLTATIQLTPRDRFDHNLGPIRGDIINLWSSSGRFNRDAAGKLIYKDMMNGSYNFTLIYPEGEVPEVTASVGNVITSVNEKVDVAISKRWSLSIHSGMSAPTGIFANDNDPGFNTSLDVDYHFSTNWSTVLYLGYNAFKSKLSGIDDNHIVNISVNGRYTRPVRKLMSIYLQAGPGFYIPDIGDSGIGGNIGFGIDYHFNPSLDFELGVDYHASFDLEIQFIQTQVGVVYKFNL